MSNNLDKEVAVKILGAKNPTVVWDYTTNAIHDYHILKYIRENWTGSILQLYLGALVQEYAKRSKDPALLFLQYQPGDYSKAALKVCYFAEQENIKDF